jgi:hypothetical protein
MFKPDVPLRIMRDVTLSPSHKAFLLWCWHCRETDDRCDLISCRQDCNLRERSIKWYADFFNMSYQHFYARVFKSLESRGIIKTEQVGTRNEMTYVDFTTV